MLFTFGFLFWPGALPQAFADRGGREVNSQRPHSTSWHAHKVDSSSRSLTTATPRTIAGVWPVCRVGVGARL